MTEQPTPLDGSEKDKASSSLGRRGIIFVLLIVALGLYLKTSNQATEVVQQSPKNEGLTGGDGTYTPREESSPVVIRAGGTVLAKQTIPIYSPISGRLTEVAELGSKVTTAGVIAKFDSGPPQRKADRAKAVYDKAQAELEQVKRSSEARPEDIRIFQSNVDIAKADFDAAQAELAAVEVKAPVNGLLDFLHVVKGQEITAGQPIGEIVNEQDYVVEIWVTASDAASLHIDSTATVEFSSRRGESYAATVSGIGIAIDRSAGISDNVPVHVRFEDGQELDWLRVGLHGARLEIPAIKQVIPVPRAAVTSQGDSHVVFVRSGNRFVPRAVQIGLFDDEMIEVIEGLKAGETIAAD